MNPLHPSHPLVTRRRVLSISAAAAGLAIVPFAARPAAEAHLVNWRGLALGTVAALQIHHRDRAAAERLVERSVAELRRLEQLLSLYRPDSALVALNQHGFLEAPAPEIVELLSECRRYSELTRGAFDVTVQPLWSLYADHFSRPDADPSGPDRDTLAEVLHHVGYENVRVSRDRIALARHGMQLTLNGIAQGYITDRVVDLLRAEGVTQTLVDMGETRCLDAHPDGRPWQVGIADPDHPSRTRETLPIVNQAVATSGAYGFRFDPLGRFNHLFDPKTGGSAHAYRSVTVVTARATEADALSTAFSLVPVEEMDRVLARLGQGSVHLIRADGSIATRHA